MCLLWWFTTNDMTKDMISHYGHTVLHAKNHQEVSILYVKAFINMFLLDMSSTPQRTYFS